LGAPIAKIQRQQLNPPFRDFIHDPLEGEAFFNTEVDHQRLIVRVPSPSEIYFGDGVMEIETDVLNPFPVQDAYTPSVLDLESMSDDEVLTFYAFLERSNVSMLDQNMGTRKVTGVEELVSNAPLFAHFRSPIQALNQVSTQSAV